MIVLRRVRWIMSPAAGVVVLLLTGNMPFAVVVILTAACVLSQLPPSWLVSVGLVFLCVTAGLDVLDHLGWINQDPHLTFAAAEVGLFDLHAAANQAAVYSYEMFFGGIIGYIVQLARKGKQNHS